MNYPILTIAKINILLIVQWYFAGLFAIMPLIRTTESLEICYNSLEARKSCVYNKELQHKSFFSWYSLRCNLDIIIIAFWFCAEPWRRISTSK